MYSCANFPSVVRNGEEKPSPGLSPNKDDYPMSRFSDIPVPSRFKFDRNKSFIYESGTGSVKVGRLFFCGWASQGKVITFYENEMINNGWTLIRIIEHEGTTLIYQKEDRVCTVFIGSSLGRSEIEIQTGPK